MALTLTEVLIVCQACTRPVLIHLNKKKNDCWGKKKKIDIVFVNPPRCDALKFPDTCAHYVAGTIE